MQIPLYHCFPTIISFSSLSRMDVLKHLSGEFIQRPPDQMPSSPQVAPSNSEEQQLFSINDVRVPQLICEANPSHLPEEPILAACIAQPCRFGHYPELMTTDEGRNVHQPVNPPPCQLFLHHYGWVQRLHYHRSPETACPSPAPSSCHLFQSFPVCDESHRPSKPTNPSTDVFLRLIKSYTLLVLAAPLKNKIRIRDGGQPWQNPTTTEKALDLIVKWEHSSHCIHTGTEWAIKMGSIPHIFAASFR